ncbi:MAG TPA: ubiquinol-cytochrome C chaperone family protein [Alphaproteobacteria bacterium]
MLPWPLRKLVPAARRRERALRAAAVGLYAAAVAQARRPEFYAPALVPDTVDGRFDLVVLHVVLLVRRLNRDGADGADLAQHLFDTTLDDMDRNLREMGAGDLGVGRRVKAMARAFYGRARAYGAALDAGDRAALETALARNLLGVAGEAHASAAPIAAYVIAAEDRLAALDRVPLWSGSATFPAPPVAGA